LTAFVLDASVAAKWFLPAADESLAAEALQILREFSRARIRLLVPDLFWAEFGNVLWKAARAERISRKAAEESIQTIEQAGLQTVSSATLLRNAFAIAATTDRTVYDAMYVALAIDSAAPFVTADERLANALAARFPVRWLGALY
jgi:predicted nucleic acid-binding protein